MITLKRFNGALVTPKDDAVLFDHIVDDSGILEGISVSHLGANRLLVAAGRGIIKGRDFTVEEDTILAQLSPSGTQKGRLLIRLDISNTEAPISLVTQVATSLPALVQEDINRDGTIYELSLATYDVSELLISNLVFVGKMLQPLKGKLADHVDNGDIHLTPSEKTKVLGGSNAWVATDVTMEASNTGYNLTVPNFVFTEGCSVTFKAPLAPIETPWLFVRVAGVMYAIRTPQGRGVNPTMWATNATITVTLSTQKFNLGNTGDERSGTAFYSGDQPPTNRVATECTLLLDTYSDIYTLTIPNFVYQDGCSVTIPRMPKNPLSLKPRFLLINGIYYQLVMHGLSVSVITSDMWVENSPVTFYLSNVIKAPSDPMQNTALLNTSPVIKIAPAGTTDFSGYPNGSYIFVKR